MDHNVHKPMHKMDHGMHLWFHSGLGDNVLFDFWRIDGLALTVLAFLSEYSRFQLWIMETRRFRESVGGYSTFGVVAISPRKPSWIFGVVYAIQLTLGYVSMQIFMTYSIWLGLALCLGGTAGFCYFEHQRRLIQRTSLLK